MKNYTELELEAVENRIINEIDSVTREMSQDTKKDLLEMIIDSLESMVEE